MSLISRFRAWRAQRAHLREWPLERRIEHARVIIETDARWMAHDPTVRALCERYLAAISDDWYRTEVEDVSDLRRRLRLDPHAAPPEAMPTVPHDPMDWPLPCDVTVGGGTLRKGVTLRSLVERTKTLYRMATGSDPDEVANRTPEERARRLKAFQDQIQALPTTNPSGGDDASPDTHLLQTR